MDTKQLMEWSDKHLMFTAKRNPVALVRGEGVRVWDSEGKEYLDFTGGIAVTALGHSHPRVVGTMREQAATLLHVSNLFYIPQQIHLAKLLCDHSFADRVFFSNSGAEANETAIKLARKWAKEHGASDRGDIISMRGGFHGRTLATVTATAQEKYHHGFEPLSRRLQVRAVQRPPRGRAGHRQPDGRRARRAHPGRGWCLSSRTTAICRACASSATRRGSPDLRRDPDGHGADGEALGL